jgi:hypothetical protein
MRSGDGLHHVLHCSCESGSTVGSPEGLAEYQPNGFHIKRAVHIAQFTAADCALL